LTAAIDWFTQPAAVLAFVGHARSGFWIEAVEEALARHGKLDICNTDQGSQVASIAFS